jgi:hypothetical protein
VIPQIAIHILLLSVGAMVGYRAPDIDLAPVLIIRHRSVFTHGPLFAFIAWWAAMHYPAYSFLPLGFLAGLVIHLLKDAAPRQWKGSAVITLAPLPWSLPAWLSALYILAGAISSAYAFVVLVKA